MNFNPTVKKTEKKKKITTFQKVGINVLLQMKSLHMTFGMNQQHSG